MLHVCSIFVWIMINAMVLILIWKKQFFVLWRDFFIFVTYLFDLELVLKFTFSFVIYIYICHLAEALSKATQMRRIEAIKTNEQ